MAATLDTEMDSSTDILFLNYLSGQSRKRKTIVSLILTSLLSVVALLFLYQSGRTSIVSSNSHVDPIPVTEAGTEAVTLPQRIAKVTMAYGDIDETYEMAIETQQWHADKHNYGMHILRQQVAQGYWNKSFYLISLLIQELVKPVEERLQWLMWFDADCMIFNDNIPLETFLPDDEAHDGMFSNTHLIFAHDDWGLNSGVFFIRVHEIPIRILADAYAYYVSRPGQDFGHAYDQVALEKVLGNYSTNLMWMPRPWFNVNPWYFEPGIMAGHFFVDGERAEHMRNWYEKMKNPFDPDTNMPFDKTFYATDVPEFWDLVVECRQLLASMEALVATTAKEEDKLAVQTLHDNLNITCTWHTDDMVKMESELENAKTTFSGFSIITETTEAGET